MKEHQSWDIKLLGYMLMAYVSLQIIFGLDTNVLYSNLLNIMLLGYYIGIAIYRKHKGLFLGRVSINYVLFTMLALLSIGWAMDMSLSFYGVRSIIILCINVILFYDIITRYKLQNMILYGFILGAIYNQAIAFDLITYFNPRQLETRRFLGTVANPNILSTIILFGLVSSGILLEKSRNVFIQLFHGINITFCFYLVFLSMSRKGIFIALVLLIIFLFKNLRSVRSIFGTAVLGFIMVYFAFTYLDMDETLVVFFENMERLNEIVALSEGNTGRTSGGLRLKYFNLGLELISKSPLWGYGYFNFRYFTGFHYSHNNYIEIFTGMGIVGFALFYGMHVAILRRIRKAVKASSNVKIMLVAAILIMLIGDLGTVSFLKKHTIAMLIFLDSYTRVVLK